MLKIALFFTVFLLAHAQYNPSYDNQYDRNRNDPSYNQSGRYDPYDSRYNQSGRNDPYDPRYNQTGRYDQYGNKDQYNRGDQYGSQNRDQYGNPRDPYNRDQYGNADHRDQYNRSQYRNPNDPYNRNDPYNKNPNDPYNRNPNDPYNRNPNDPYNRNPNEPHNRNDPYNRDHYFPNGSRDNSRDPNFNRDQYNKDPNYRDQYNREHPLNRDQYGNNRDQYGSNRDQYGNNRDPYNRDQYGSNRDQYGNNRDRYDNSDRDRFDNRYGYQTDSSSGGQIDNNDNCCREYCYTEDEQKYAYFAQKTAYQVVYGQHSNQHKIPECTPVQFWTIIRHGTRYPSVGTIERLRDLQRIQQTIIRNYEENRSYPDKGRLCPKDLELLKRWRWNETIGPQNANQITEQGIMDLKFLARRYVSRFDEILRTPYSEEAYEFQYTDSDRTHDSYQAYIEGLFNQNAYQVHANRFSKPITNPTRSCNNWRRQVEENPSREYEYMRFKENQEYKQMVRDVFRRLGFRYTLNESLVETMYDMCRFEKAWDLMRPSAWCAVFNKEQLKLLEYAEDLKVYLRNGYGNQLSKDMGCPPVKDMFEKFERTVDGSNGPVGNKVSVFFTHTTAFQTFLTAMGIAKDNLPLRADNYFQQTRRQWKTSMISPFAANLAATLYQCRSGERHRVMFFLNEVPVNYPECQVGLCNWSTVKQKLQDTANYCNLNFCDESSATALQRSYVIYLISSMVLFYLIY